MTRNGGVVLIAHYRVGWTDGVSLEIEKRYAVLKEMGFTVLLLAGPGSRGADFIIDELDFEREEVTRITRNAFGGLKDMSESQLISETGRLSDVIESRLSEIINDVKPDFILTHNIFSHGRHIAAARAFSRVLSEYGAASLTTHHDFYWEREDFNRPSCPFVREYMEKYVPPVIPRMEHAVINSQAASELEKRRGIKSSVFPDTLDFSMPPWIMDSYNSQFYKDFDLEERDILILQATRIVRRKGIELIPPLVSRLNSEEFLGRLRGKQLYNGKRITDNSRFVFLLAGYAEHEAGNYLKQLKELMIREKIEYRILNPYIASERGTAGDGRRIYSLFDTYPFADLVSYPSFYEGWGNQFLEAVFARKPIALFEYPVFISDIRPVGYQVISLGNCLEPDDGSGLRILGNNQLESASHDIIDWLLSPETKTRLDHNFQLAKENNSFDTLRKMMKQSMEHYGDI